MIKANERSCEQCGGKRRTVYKSGGSNAVYGLGMIGAIIYYVSTASGFWVGVLGVLKALVWPAFLVYELMKMVHL